MSYGSGANQRDVLHVGCGAIDLQRERLTVSEDRWKTGDLDPVGRGNVIGFVELDLLDAALLGDAIRQRQIGVRVAGRCVSVATGDPNLSIRQQQRARVIVARVNSGLFHRPAISG